MMIHLLLQYSFNVFCDMFSRDKFLITVFFLFEVRESKYIRDFMTELRGMNRKKFLFNKL